MPAATVLVVGVTVTLLTVGGLRAAQRQDADRVMDQRTAVARAAVLTETGRYLALLRAVVSGIGTNDDFTGADFDAATRPLEAAGLLGATSVAYVVPGARGADAATQASWRARGAPVRAADEKPDAAEAERAALERALAERAAVERAALPGLPALPPGGPSARESPAACLRAPVPDHPDL